MMELYAGALTQRDRRLLRRFLATFTRTGRIVVPSEGVYREAGDVLRWLQKRKDYDPASARGLTNDVLIALSASTIGALVVTQNERHFAAIRRVRPFELRIVPHPMRRPGVSKRGR